MKKYLKAEALSAVRRGELKVGIEKYCEYLALEANASDDDAWASLGGAYRRDGNIDDALACYRHAYELNPNSTYALVNLVSLQAARNTPADREHLTHDVPEAIRLCREIIERGDPSFWNWYDLGTLHLIQSNLAEGLKIFHHAIALTPETAKENFRSVLSNLRFLHDHNPRITGTEEVISLVSQHAE
ncbi:MAG: tetratricopeptide repeat protein [bacterium]